MTDELDKARRYAIAAHGAQTYGDKPYIYHLEAVVEILGAYGAEARLIGYLHDVVEDTAVTVDDISREFGAFVAACVAILSDEPGADRKERKAKTYAKMARVTGREELALLVKAADRLANIEACVAERNTALLTMYKNEHPSFTQAVYRPELCEDIWRRLHQLVDA